MTFERTTIRAMTGYTPGEQPEAPDVIKLNTNENPLPPSPAVTRALADIDAAGLRRYPPPTAAPLREVIADHHGLESGQVIVTNGGDELLRLAVATFVDPREAIAVAEPSYSLYEVLANAHGCGYVKFDLEPDWSLPADFGARLNRAGAKLCFVVNPHAPSGYLTPDAGLRRLAAEFRGVLVIDEAYVDFVDPALGHDCVPLVRDFGNVLILRTFSKGYSLAGLRMAYGLGSPALIDPMQYKTKDSYNTGLIAQRLAAAALRDQDYAAQAWAFVRGQRAFLAEQLSKLGFGVFPSQSNFLLATAPPSHTAQALYRELKQRDILVRYFNLPRLKDKLRISVGIVEENRRLMEVLSDIMGKTKNGDEKD